LTVKARPFRSRPFQVLMARCPSAAEPISTNPNPRDCPLSRSVMTRAEVTVPASENARERSSLVTL
jgi:hypothetical protein